MLTAIIGRKRQNGATSPNLVADFGAMLCSDIRQTDVDRSALAEAVDRLPNQPGKWKIRGEGRQEKV